MKEGPSRRQWLLSLVTGLFGWKARTLAATEPIPQPRPVVPSTIRDPAAVTPRVTTYTYDARQSLIRCDGAPTTTFVYDGSGTKIRVYDASGKVIWPTDGTGPGA